MKVKEITTNFEFDDISNIINKFISENDIFVIDIKYVIDDGNRYAYIH